MLEWRAGRSSVRRYWSAPFEPREGLTAEAAAEELEELLVTVVGEHLVSDVPVGVFLSAGVDSSLVTAITNRVAPDPLRAFTVSLPERENDEAADAVEIARLLGSPIDVGRCSQKDLLDGVPALPGIPAAYPTR